MKQIFPQKSRLIPCCALSGAKGMNYKNEKNKYDVYSKMKVQKKWKTNIANFYLEIFIMNFLCDRIEKE